MRRRFSGEDVTKPDWVIPEKYQIEWIAEKVREFLFDECYTPAFREAQQKPYLGFIVAGYSSDEAMAEEYQITIVNGTCEKPQFLSLKTTLD